MRLARLGRLLLTAVILMGTQALGQKLPSDLTQVSLEDLMSLRVTTSSKKEQKLSQTAAAIFVITQEDILRSGLTSIPEILRLVPGVDVARIDANKWAITSRGFNGRFANKMLVLMDGRSVYSPLFSGVQWDVQDTLLEDVERIEVIRGPGGALWGANAVNGVINIITKRAEATQGGLMVSGTGTEEHALAGLRYGGKLGHEGFYRIYAKYSNRGNLVGPGGQEAADHWDSLQGGFRMDWKASPRDALTLQGDLYNGRHGQTLLMASLFPPFQQLRDDRGTVEGGNLLARWTRTFSGRSELALQIYYDRTGRKSVEVGQAVHTSDVDFQHHFALGARQDLVWGLGSRFTADDLTNTFRASFQPPRETYHLCSAFLQDEVTAVKDRLRVTVGSKFEHNGFSGFDAQPSVRVLWTPHPRHTVWLAGSRAVKTPSRIKDIRVNLAAFPGAGGSVTLLSVFGSRAVHSESLFAYEFGYRVQPSKRFSVDLAGFYNNYDDVLAAVPGTPFFERTPLPPHLVIPQFLDTVSDGRTHGLEIVTRWDVTHSWKLIGGYSLLNAGMHHLEGNHLMEDELHSPRNQAHFRSILQFPGRVEADSAIYFVDRLASQNVAAYTRLDTRLGWRLTETLDLSLVGQNLLQARHPEFSGADSGVQASLVRRGVHGRIMWRF